MSGSAEVDDGASLDVYYKPPEDVARTRAIVELAQRFGAKLNHYQPSTDHGGVWLRFLFSSVADAQHATDAFAAAGEYTEGPYEL